MIIKIKIKKKKITEDQKKILKVEHSIVKYVENHIYHIQLYILIGNKNIILMLIMEEEKEEEDQKKI